ncbi:MAG TPA: HupE/UreJ family protein [Verrucomicrobiae bacterium]|nr:HupE/UreJ family protein [Verrucomicrobiae bacterium]
MKTISRSLWISAAFLLLTGVGAQAHMLPNDVHGFGSGFAHPLHGLDHILVMVAVGLWAAQLGGRARWMVPASFVGVMMLGGALAMGGLRVPFTEQGILLSVSMLGVLIAVAARFPLAASMAIVGVFAFFHGHSHGTEMPANAVGYAYGAGFALATVLLHASGIALANAVKNMRLPVVRWAGAAIAVAGICLWAF